MESFWQTQIDGFKAYLNTVPTSWKPENFTCGTADCFQSTSPDCPDTMRCERHLAEKFESLEQELKHVAKEIARFMEAKR